MDYILNLITDLDISDIFSMLLGTFLGAVVSLVISLVFFRKASKDLKAKVYRLEFITTLLARYLEKERVIKDLELDERGILKGYTQTINAGFIPAPSEF